MFHSFVFIEISEQNCDHGVCYSFFIPVLTTIIYQQVEPLLRIVGEHQRHPNRYHLQQSKEEKIGISLLTKTHKCLYRSIINNLTLTVTLL